MTVVLLALASLAVASPAIAAPEDLRPGLLAAEDLPLGFIATAMATDADGSVSIGGNFPGCPDLEPVTGKGTTSAAATFAKGFVGPYVTHALVRLPSAAAVTALDRIAAAVTTCKTFSQELAGITVRFELALSQVPANLGDKAIGVKMTGSTDFGISVTADIIAVRRGDLILWLNDTAVGTAPAGLIGPLAQKAVARCTENIKGC